MTEVEEEVREAGFAQLGVVWDTEQIGESWSAGAVFAESGSPSCRW